MSISFIEEMTRVAHKNNISFAEKKQQRKNELFNHLTEKYHESIKQAIKLASSHGKTEKHINFEKEDFKANFPGLGNPKKVCEDWLKELCTPQSPALQGNKTCFIGLKFDVWYNFAFTVHFTWPASPPAMPSPLASPIKRVSFSNDNDVFSFFT